MGLKRIKLSSYVSVLALIILVLVFWFINNNFLRVENIHNILTDLSPLLIMSSGVTFILLLGSTDLSVGATCSLAAVIFAKYADVLGIAIYPAVILFGAFSGLLVGLLYVKLKVPSFIASLGIMSVWQSIALIVSDYGPVQLKPAQWGLVAWTEINFEFIPSVFIIGLIIVALFYFLERQTSLGRYIYAIGANERSARFAGVPCVRTKMVSFIMGGMCYAFAAIIFTAKLTSGSPNLGDDFTLLAIASVVLGGTALSGGKGSIKGTVLGVAMVTIIKNGMTVANIDAFWQRIIFGAIVIIAAYMTADRSDKELVIK